MKTRILVFLLMSMILFGAAAAADTLTLTFVGDASIGDAISSRGHQNSFHSVVLEKGMDWPFSLVKDTLL
ncbi:MAG: hypothetical protein GX540_07615, partial [Clostridiales bacterium]|nr:hypothetical protein [Clostridiales bacterium]